VSPYRPAHNKPDSGSQDKYMPACQLGAGAVRECSVACLLMPDSGLADAERLGNLALHQALLFEGQGLETSSFFPIVAEQFKRSSSSPCSALSWD
jgi:hypothetical protein